MRYVLVVTEIVRVGGGWPDCKKLH